MSPKRALRLCSSPGCTAIVSAGKCARHAARAREQQLARWREYETRRPPRAVPTWAAAWRRVRARFLLEHPFCSCGALSLEVHHLVPVSADPSRALDAGNLVALCRSCHQRLEKTK